MAWKQIFCKHRWIQTGVRHELGSDGYILETYFQMKCKKCGKRFETKYRDNFKFEIVENQTSNIQEEELKRILNSNGTHWY